MSASTPRFSIVVPTWNRPGQLGSMLESFTRLECPTGGFEVIVADDGSRVPLDAVAERFHGRLDLRLLRVSHRGPAAARQAGIDTARGELLAFTDDDCAPDPGWLRALERAFEEEPEAAYGGGVVNALHDNPFSEATQVLIDFICAPESPRWLRFFTTSNLAFPAAAFREIGGLDVNWSNSGGEDRDLCARWLASGRALRPAKDAVVLHSHALTFRRFLSQHFYYGRGSRLFHARHGGVSRTFRERAGFAGGLLATALRGRDPLARRLALAVLLGLSQVATAAGYATGR